MDTIQLIIAIAGLITSLATITAVLVARKTFLADHERRKKQATIELYHKISAEMTIPFRFALLDAFGGHIGKRPINPEDDKWNNNPDLKEKLVCYCKAMEKLAVGISIDVYCYDTFSRMSGRDTLDLFEKIEPLIKHEEGTLVSYDFCMEYRSLCKKLKDGTGMDTGKGKILHS